MRVRKKERVKSTGTTGVILTSIVIGVAATAFFGPAGLLIGVMGFAGGYPVSKREANEEANNLIHHGFSHSELRHAFVNGKRAIRIKTELKNIHPDVSLFGRILVGDKLTKETTYFLEE